MPLPREPRTVFQGTLCLIAVLACLYIAKDIVLPVMLAIVLKLLLQPFVRLLERARVPKAVGALLALALLLSVFVGLGMLLSTPATRWVNDLPQAWPRLQEKFVFLGEPVDHVRHTLGNMGVDFGGPGALLADPMGIATAVFGGTGKIASYLLEMLLVLFYLLVFGETFLRRLVEVPPDICRQA